MCGHRPDRRDRCAWRPAPGFALRDARSRRTPAPAAQRSRPRARTGRGCRNVTSAAPLGVRASAEDPVRVLAFYRLPGALTPGNATGGENLPEWSTVRMARPVFVGHDQPQLPGEFGYCDVRDRAVREAHATLARDCAIAGFCYVFQAAAATDVLDPTLAAIASSGLPEF